MKAFKKIIGYESVKKELYQIIDMFKNNEIYESMGAKLPKGLLIYGNPGLGKTLMAEAFIEECNVKSFVVKMNNDQETLLKDINEIFLEASKLDKAIIFFDDLDKFSEKDKAHVDDKVFVNIQSNIDNVKDKNIFVIATVNNIKKLPSSLIRNGRFDIKIPILIPTKEDAAKIMEYYLKSKKINSNLNFEDVSKMISYTSCADLDTILNESAISAAYQRKDAIDIDDIVKAYCRELYNVPNEALKCSEEELYSVSLHEAGHAAIAEAIKPNSVGLISIQPYNRGRANGFTKACLEMNRRPEAILVALGGKVACELFDKGRCASGCQDDLSKAMSLIRNGINDNGTCGVGLLTDSNELSFGVSQNGLERSEVATQAELERYMFIAKDILLKNKDYLLKVAENLKNKRYLLYSDLKKIKDICTITYYQDKI